MTAHSPVERAPFDLNAAHMEAHRWVEVARPLIKAYLAIDQIHADVLGASYGAGVYAYSVKGAADDIGKAVGKLWDDIENIRDAVLADLSPPAPNWGRNLHECSPEVIDYDDLCDQWQERIGDVLSVDSAIGREARSDD
ncbi:MAG: hypothetical protein ABW043_16925 [Devosia sp.]|uniref:hypothetical protein n=1 Tax=Devosia sp. TaxID=1871048 RepID=UPI003390B7F0